MNRILKISAVMALALSLSALAGCSASSEKNAKSDAMSAAPTGVWGYVAGEQYAQLEVEGAQLGVDSLTVARVLAPTDAWVVVHLDDNGKPGARVGVQHISKGENLDVQVELKDVTSPKVIVAVHADKGESGVFDFDMKNMMKSPDRPFFVNEKELATVVTVRDFGIKATADEASLTLSDQPGASDSIVVDKVSAPEPAWIVVHLDNDGMPGKRVGYLSIPAGTSSDVVVKLSQDVKLTDSLLVAVHADRGDRGVLDFDMTDLVGSPDQPFFVDGKELAGAIRVK